MEYNISRELFESVIGIKVSNDMYEVNDTVVRYHVESKEFSITRETMLINDLFFKCFDWAYENGYTLSFCTNDLSRLLRYGCLAEPIDNSSNYKEILSHNAHQTVFDVCQWILDNKVKK